MTPQTSPRVSVIVPLHNVAPWVGAAVASLRAQTLTDFEALVVDDGSTDGSGDVAAVAWGDDLRFRLIRQGNAGLSAARNAGLALARGQWLAFLDGDDAYEPGFLHTLLRGAQAAGLPWAASGLWLDDGGTAVPHSGLHGTPDPARLAPRRVDLDDAPGVARLFPSAWTKVYDRAVWGDLRFRPGTWFEDHEAFWAFAARAPAIWHDPAPLIRHRRNRAGQITGADDDRVFDVFGVLDRVAPLAMARPQGAQGLAGLAARLIDERARVLRHPARRARFLAAAGAWLDRAGLSHTPPDAEGLSLGLTLALRGRVPLTVLALPGAEAGGAGPDDQVLRVEDPTLDQALAGARGAYVLVLPPGARLAQGGTGALVDAALRHGADLALGTLRVAGGGHDGWTDNRAAPHPPGTLPPQGAAWPLPPGAALRLHPSPARMVLALDLARALPPLSVPLRHPMAGAELVLRAALVSRRGAFVPHAVADVDPGPPPDPQAVLDWARGLDVPPGWGAVLALRALSPGFGPAASARGLAVRVRLAAAMARRGVRLGAQPADPAAGRLMSWLAGGGWRVGCKPGAPGA